MDDPLAKIKTSIGYQLVVVSIALTSANYIADRLNLRPRPISQRDVTGFYVSPPGLDEQRFRPGATLWTTNYNFVFRDGKLFTVMNANTNIESVEHYRQWAKMSSLIDSNGAYHLATQWLSRVFVDVAELDRRYKVGVGQPFFWGDEGANSIYPSGWHVGTNKVALPLYYVSWSRDGNQAAKVGIFGPSKQLMGLTIDDLSLCSHTYLFVTNQKELVEMTNVPWPLVSSNRSLYQRLIPKSPRSPNEAR